MNWTTKRCICRITGLTLIISTLVPAAGFGALLYTPAQYNRVYNEKVALELELQSLKRQYGNDKANLEASIAELKNRVEGLERELENLRAQMDEEKKQSATRIRELEEMIALLQKKGSDREKELVEENKRLQQRCADDMNALREKLEGERKRHLEEIGELKGDYERKIADLNKAILNMKQELADLQNLTKKQKEELSRMEDQAKELESQLAEEIKKGEITLKRFHDRLIINIDEKISFDSGSAQLKRDVMPALEKITAILNNYPENKIIVEGHTDNVPIRTSRFRDNWQLSTERALSVLAHILRSSRTNPARFSAAGYGEYNPVVPNDTPENRALNRRVDIVVAPRLTQR